MTQRIITGLTISVACLMGIHANAQRQMEPLGRGVVAMRKSTTQAYISWRLLGDDPQDVGFRLYRVAGGVTNVLNGGGMLTTTTDYVDTPNFSLSNSYFVRPVIGGVEQAPSASHTLGAGAPVRQYVSWPMQPVTGGQYGPYDVKFCWVGDLDADGEYDYVVDRLSTTTASRQYVQAYTSDGTFLWQADMGINSVNQYAHEPGSSAISVGHGDNMTVYDLDGDGHAEVIIRTANGVTVTNASGVQVASITAPNDTVQFISVFDGLTGVELSRATVPNPYFADGPLTGHMGIMYCDGVHPSILFESANRIGGGHFNLILTTWDYRAGQLVHRWDWERGYNPYGEGHQIRIADVDHDGRDEFCEIGFVVDDDGQLLFNAGLAHGDRYHITDIDPTRPGMETYIIQQNNPNLLATELYESGTGDSIKKWYAPAIVDVGRGIALDMDPNYRGCEMYSTQPGIFDAKGNQIWDNNLWAPEAIWWDADLSREFEDGAGSGALSPVINKYNPSNGTTYRLYSIYQEGVHQAYGGRAAFWGDILGDWREEVVLVANDYSELRVYTTTIPAANRLYCLMQNPAYRMQATCKGYYQANYVDYYLGTDMEPPAPAPMSSADLVWRGGVSGNAWDVATSANWATNRVWTIPNPATVFNTGNRVLFDLTGGSNASVNLSASLTPAEVHVYSSSNYVFQGAGSLAGTMALTKSGAGSLTMNTTNTYSGATLVAEGSLIVNGRLENSPVTVRGGVWHDGRLAGHGFVGSPLTVRESGSVSPGLGLGSPGTLTIGANVTETGWAVNEFDLSDDASGTFKTNDLLNILGDLTLVGDNTLHINPLDATLPPGTYPLITYSGSFNGSLAAINVTGLPGIPITLINPPGQIALVVQSTRAPTTLTWAGGLGGNVWDLVTTSNFWNGGVRDQFVPLDTVRFDNTGAANPVVTLDGLLNMSGAEVDGTGNYTFNGPGSMMGAGGLTKLGSGTLTLNTTANTYTGPTVLGGGTVVVTSMEDGGKPSSLGAPGSGPGNLVFSGGALRFTGTGSYTDRAVVLQTGVNPIEVAVSGATLGLFGQLSGPGGLVKEGVGTLMLSAANSYAGGTLIKAGKVLLGNDTANLSGLGSGGVTFNNGTLEMYGDTGSYNNANWNMIVPAGYSGTLLADGRCDLYGSLTGGGNFTLYTPFVRTTLHGNWSAFAGTINVTTDGDGGDFRVDNSSGYGNAIVHLNNNVYAYRLNGGSISIGAVSGDSGAIMTGTSWIVGGRNADTTFAGTIVGNSIVKVGTGTWTLSGNSTYTGTTTVSAGTLMVNGDHSAAAGTVSVNSSGTLAGTGIIGGNTTVAGRLAPGNNAIGTLTVNGNLVFGGSGTASMEIRKSPVGQDLADVAGTVAYGGTLHVVNLGGALVSGDSFKLFDAGSYAGSFVATSLPPLTSGLVWDTSGLGTSGTIRVTVGASAGPQVLSWKGDGAGNAWDIEVTPNWLDTNDAPAYFSNGDTVLFDDTGSNNVPVVLNVAVQPAAVTVDASRDFILTGTGSIVGTNSLLKSGSGMLTLLTTNEYTGSTTLSAGTLVVLGLGDGLAHRWSFNNSLVDSAGGQNATLVEVGANNGTLTANQVTLTGGAKDSSDYVDLGDDVLPNGTAPVTIEVWATPYSVQNWSRVFDFGASTAENVFMSWTRGTTLTQDRVEWVDTGGTLTSDDTCQPYSLGVEYHLAMVIEPGLGAGGTTRVTWYRAPSANGTLGAARGTFDTANTLPLLNDVNCWLGRSQWPDNTANASYNEVRIWHRSLSAGDLQMLHTHGPDAGMRAALPAITAVHLNGPTATLDLQNDQTQIIGSLSGVAGSEVKLTQGSLTAGGDNSSTTFAGLITGGGSLTKVGGGTMTLAGDNSFAGVTTVSSGRLIVGGNQSAGTGALTVSPGAILGGNGTVGGPCTISGGATLAPGASIGSITFNNSLQLGGTTLMEVSHSPLTNDVVRKVGGITYGGVLQVDNTVGALVAGDKFRLFEAAGYGGAFSSLILPPLGAGLAWKATELPVSGTLWVVSTAPPLINSPRTVGPNFTFNGIEGTPGLDYYVLSSADVAMPLVDWIRVETNQFDMFGNCSFSTPVDPSAPARFYVIEVP